MKLEIEDLKSKLKMVQDERDDLIVKLHQTRSSKKSLSNKLKSKTSYHNSLNTALRLCVDFETYQQILELTSNVYLGRWEKRNCRCNPRGCFIYADERCDNCHGLGYVYIEKITNTLEQK